VAVSVGIIGVPRRLIAKTDSATRANGKVFPELPTFIEVQVHVPALEAGPRR